MPLYSFNRNTVLHNYFYGSLPLSKWPSGCLVIGDENTHKYPRKQ